jgi:signal transduction histidine kinase
MADEAKRESAADVADLLRENRNLKRQLRSLESLQQRNKAMLAARANVNALLTSQQRKMGKNMNLLLENSPDIILLFDQGGRFTHCTKTFLTAAGIANFGLINGHLFTDVFKNFVSPSQLDSLQNNYRKAMWEHKTVVAGDALLFPGLDAVHVYEINITPMLGEGGSAEGAMMLFHDLTDIVKAKDAAENANKAKSEFLATISHEIRTPLNAIIGMSHISRTADSPEKRELALQKIETASISLLGIINDVLDMAKIESGRLELDEELFEPAQIVSDVVSVVSHRLEEKGQSFTLDVDPTLPSRLVGDGQRLSQVITNLLGNAVKFTPEGGKISLHVQVSGRRHDACQIRFAVTDTGIGISAEQQQKLFRSFVQADSSVTRRFGGTGLGLAIAKSIVEMMGGEIGVESEVDCGARFYFTAWMKLEDKAEPAAAAGPGAQPAPADYTGLFAGRRVLLAEDIEINQEIVIALLEPTGAHIDTAQNGRAALCLFEENAGDYDLVLMDIHMPEMDGYEAARRIRANPLSCGKTVPIIALTANAFKEDIERCLAAGMNDHISKPVVVDKMMAAMRRHLRR